MSWHLLLCFFLFSFVFSQGAESSDGANLSFDEDVEKHHLQSIDGVAALVGDRVVLKSDINQTLAMAVFQQRLYIIAGNIDNITNNVEYSEKESADWRTNWHQYMAQFCARMYHVTIVVNGSMMTIGG